MSKIIKISILKGQNKIRLYLPRFDKVRPRLNDKFAESDVLRGGEASLVVDGRDRTAEQEVELVACLAHGPTRRSFVRISDGKFVPEMKQIKEIGILIRNLKCKIVSVKIFSIYEMTMDSDRKIVFKIKQIK